MARNSKASRTHPKKKAKQTATDSIQTAIAKAYTKVGYLYAQSLLGSLSPLKAADLLKAEQGIIDDLNRIQSDPGLGQKEQWSVQNIIQDVQEAKKEGFTCAYLQFGLGFNPAYLDCQESQETQGFVSLCTIYYTLENPRLDPYSALKLFDPVFNNLHSLLSDPKLESVKNALEKVCAHIRQNPGDLNGPQLAAQLRPAIKALLPFFKK